MNEKGQKQDMRKGDELPPESELSLEAQQKKIESVFGKSLKCFARWGVIGAAVGALFVSEKFAEYTERLLAWQQYISSTLSPVEIQKMKRNDEKLEKLFGEDVVVDIDFGDSAALFARQDERGKPQRKAPESQTENPNQEWSRAKMFFDSAEEYKLCPKGWINGEVDVVQYVDELGGLIPGVARRRAGRTTQHSIAGTVTTTLYLYRIPMLPYAEGTSRKIFLHKIYHELAHANDWETDMDLNVLQRQELLLNVHDRMMSPNAYHRKGAPYHSVFIDGTKEGLYRAAREYWADICGRFFSDPVNFRKRFPADFDLVTTQVKINDPSFDVFDERRIDFHHLP